MGQKSVRTSDSDQPGQSVSLASGDTAPEGRQPIVSSPLIIIF